MDLILVRHAESIANTQNIYQGRTYDTDLTGRGKKQAEAAAKAIAKLGNFDAVYASPLKRAWQTAQIISQIALLPEPIAENRLTETNHGLWEGLSVNEIETTYPELINAWKTEPASVTFPEGENLDQMLDRCMVSLQEIASRHSQRILIVTHDNVIRIILTKLLRRQLNDLWLFSLDNAGYSLIEWNDKLATVVKINESAHLTGLTNPETNQAL